MCCVCRMLLGRVASSSQYLYSVHSITQRERARTKVVNVTLRHSLRPSFVFFLVSPFSPNNSIRQPASQPLGTYPTRSTCNYLRSGWLLWERIQRKQSNLLCPLFFSCSSPSWHGLRRRVQLSVCWVSWAQETDTRTSYPIALRVAYCCWLALREKTLRRIIHWIWIEGERESWREERRGWHGFQNTRQWLVFEIMSISSAYALLAKDNLSSSCQSLFFFCVSYRENCGASGLFMESV